MVAANIKTLPNTRIGNKPLYDRLYEGILMVIQKATAPSVTISPAVIGLCITIFVQSGLGIWWAASISKDSVKNESGIETLKKENSTMKVYIDNLREKQIKMEATQ